MRFFILLFAIIFSSISHAAEPLIFRGEARDVRERTVLTLLENLGKRTKDTPFSMAAVDLNGDGVNEWIYKDIKTGCEAGADCAFSIIGLSQKEPTLLANINAGKIAVSDEKLYGVRKLLVYNQKNDDFTYQTFAWTPLQMTFTPE